eukprot:scaffold34167_cov18-Tisochrysis_lutea.AAC.1
MYLLLFVTDNVSPAFSDRHGVTDQRTGLSSAPACTSKHAKPLLFTNVGVKRFDLLANVSLGSKAACHTHKGLGGRT